MGFILQILFVLVLAPIVAVKTTRAVEQQAIRSAERLDPMQKCGVLWAMQDDWPDLRPWNAHVVEGTRSLWIGEHVTVCSGWQTDTERKVRMAAIQQAAYDNEVTRLTRMRGVE